MKPTIKRNAASRPRASASADRLFAGHTAIVSGGLGDIGRAIALAFAQHGAAVALGDLKAHPPADFIAELRAHGVRCRYDRVDVSDAAAVARWVAAVETDLGLADLIVPNAAKVTLANWREVTPEQWSSELRTNLDGAFFMAQAAARRLLHQRLPGRIVFLGSWAADRPHAHIPAYCAAKAGLRMLCRCLALDLAPQGILVNEVAPGYVNAGLSKQVWEQRPELRAEAVKKVPIRKLITPEDVALQVVALCHPENRHETGAVRLMDGGLSLLT